MDFISKLLQRKPSKSGGGSNGQSSVAGVPVDSLISSCKENVGSSSTAKPPCDPTPKLSVKVSDSASSEGLKTVRQVQDSSKFKSVETHSSLPDLLLPEAAYKKQSDTDTDPSDYESAPDTYESATETDVSEAVTPSEKYVGRVVDEIIVVDEVTGSTFIDDSKDESSAEHEAKNITCEGDNSMLKECTCNAGKSAHSQDAPIVSDDKKLAQQVAEEANADKSDLSHSQEAPIVSDDKKLAQQVAEEANADKGDLSHSQDAPIVSDDKKLAQQVVEEPNADKSDLSHSQDAPIVRDDKELAQQVAEEPKADKSDLSHSLDAPIVSDNKELAQQVAEELKSTDLSLCEAFSQLSLSSPHYRSSIKEEVDLGGTSWTDETESNESVKTLLDTTYPVSPCTLDETLNFTSPLQIEDNTLLINKLDSNHDLSFLNFGQKEGSIHTTDVGDAEHTLAVKFLPGETDVNKLAENRLCELESVKKLDICLLSNGDELAEPVTFESFEVENNSVPSVLIDEKVEVPKEEKTEVINIHSLDEKTICKSTDPEDKTDNSNIPSKELPPSYLSSRDVESIFSGSLTDPLLPTPLVGKCLEIEEGSILDLGHRDSDFSSCLNITEHSTEGIVENSDDKHLLEKNEICDLGSSEQTPAKKSETVLAVCESVANRTELYTTEECCLSLPVSTEKSLPSDTQSSESGNFEKDQLLSQDPILLVDAFKPDGSQNNEQVPSNTCQTKDDRTGDNSFYESSIVDDESLEIRPKKIVLDIKEEEFGDDSKLNQLIEICNRQQADLNQTIAEFVQDTLISRLFGNVQDSCDRFTTISTDPAECESSVLSLPLPQEEKNCNIAENDLKFEDISLEASKVAESILHSSEETDLDSESETLLTVPLKMADSEEFTTPCTGNPMLSKTSIHHTSPPSDVHSKCSDMLNSMNEVCNDAPERNSSALPLSNIATDKEKIITRKSAHPEVNQSEAGPDIADEVSCKAEDVFKDASAFDFLSAIGSTQAAQDLRKQSLYVKFDPLVESMSQTEKNKVSSSSAEPCRERISSVAASGGSKALELVEKLISVTPTPKKRDEEIMNKRSASSIPKELFPVKKEEVVEVSKQEEQSVESRESSNEEVLHLREELERLKQQMMEEAAVHEQEKEELRNKLRDSEVARRNAEESERRKDRLLTEKSQSLSQMSIILEEYEKTISRLVAEKEHEKQAQSVEVTRLTKEKDTMSTHLENMEIAFSDVHQKYEKSKQVIQGFAKNEEALRASLAEYESTIKKQEQKYDVLKTHAMAQLEGANEELNALHRNHQVELTKLRAMLKKAELKVTSLEEVVEQKTKENQELVTICDELIGNVEPK